MLVKNFKTSQHLAKLERRKLIVSRTLCAWALYCWKTKNSPDILSMDELTVLLWFWLGLIIKLA